MLPGKYIRDIESSAKRGLLIHNLSVSAVFIVSFLALGPIIHEAAHIFLLEVMACFYTFNSGFSVLHGIHATVKPLCSPPKSFLLVFYSAGYVSTMLAGSFLIFIADRLERYQKHAAAAGTGTLLSIVLTVGVEGDVANTLLVFGLEPGLALPINIFIVLGILVTSIRGVEKMV